MQPIRVINGNGRGGKLSEFKNTDIDPMSIGHNDYFLDHVTGDLYTYKHEADEWAPVANTGLHYHRAANEYNTLGKYVLNTPIYRPKSQNIANQFNFIEQAEAICRLKKHEYSHWLFTGVNPEFIVASKSRWEIHPFSFIDPSKVCAVLAESKSGAMIIEYRNIIGVQFEIQKRYPTTLVIFKNFLETKLRKLVEDVPRQMVPVAKYKELETAKNAFFGYIFKKNGDTVEVKGTEALGVRLIENSSQNKNRRQMSFSNSERLSNQMDLVQQKVFLHSGYASKHKGPQIVVQNAIGSDNVQASRKVKKYSEIGSGFGTLDESELSAIKPDSFLSGDVFSPKIKKKVAHRMHRILRQATETPISRKIEPRVSNFSPERSPMESDGFTSHGGRISTESDMFRSFKKSEVRRIIYPSLDDEFIGEDKSWVTFSYFRVLDSHIV